jgi:hypothetical protein
MSQRGHTSRLPTEKGGFTSNRTRATNRNTPFPLPEAQSKATENDGRDRSCAEKKGGEIRPVGTISREVMRARPRHMRSTGSFGRMLHPRAALEQLYQTFCIISSETSCLPPRIASSHFCLCFDNGHGFLLFHKRGKDRSEPPESLRASV